MFVLFCFVLPVQTELIEEKKRFKMCSILSLLSMPLLAYGLVLCSWKCDLSSCFCDPVLFHQPWPAPFQMYGKSSDPGGLPGIRQRMSLGVHVRQGGVRTDS